MIKVDFDPPVAHLRQFGWVGLLGFPLIAVVFMPTTTGWSPSGWQPNTLSWVLFGLGALCPVLAVLAPAALRPLFVAMSCVAMPIGMVVTAVLLRLVYYLLITPMAFWFRLRGRDAMQRTLQPEWDSYWLDHRDVARPRAPASYLRLY